MGRQTKMEGRKTETVERGRRSMRDRRRVKVDEGKEGERKARE